MNTLNVTPIGNGVLIELQEIKETTPGGIILADTVENKEELLKTNYEGDIVVAIGPDCKQVQVGDLAYFNLHVVAKPCVLNGKRYLLYREGDINVIINK